MWAMRLKPLALLLPEKKPWFTLSWRLGGCWSWSACFGEDIVSCFCQDLNPRPSYSVYSLCRCQDLNPIPSYSVYSLCRCQDLNPIPSYSVYSLCRCQDLNPRPSYSVYSLCCCQDLNPRPSYSVYSLCCCQDLNPRSSRLYPSQCTYYAALNWFEDNTKVCINRMRREVWIECVCFMSGIPGRILWTW